MSKIKFIKQQVENSKNGLSSKEIVIEDMLGAIFELNDKLEAHINADNLDTTVNLCDSCAKDFSECDAEYPYFGNGVGNDNVYFCDAYKPKKICDTCLGHNGCPAGFTPVYSPDSCVHWEPKELEVVSSSQPDSECEQKDESSSQVDPYDELKKFPFSLQETIGILSSHLVDQGRNLVSVVRCEDCGYFDLSNDKTGYGMCRKLLYTNGLVNESLLVGTGNFCSWGERR